MASANGFHVSAVDPDVPFGQRGLIDQPEGVIFPDNGWNGHRS